MFHYLGPQSLYTCKQQHCFRDFLELDKFRKHLTKYHITDDIDTALNIEHKSPTKSNYFLPDSDVIINEIVNESNFISGDLNEDNIDKDFKNVVTSSILSFIANLYSKPNVTAILLQDIINGVNELFSNEIIPSLKKKLCLLYQHVKLLK